MKNKTPRKARRKLRWGRIIWALIALVAGVPAIAGASIGLTELLGWKWVVVSWSTTLLLYVWVISIFKSGKDGYDSKLPPREESVRVYGVEPYDNELRGVLYFIERATPYALATIGAVVVSCLLAVPYGWEVAATLVYGVLSLGWLLVYRQYWKWQHRPCSYNPGNGVFTEWETENWWLGISGSAPEKYRLEERPLQSPTRSLIEKLFKNQALKVVDADGNVKVLRHLRNYQLITRIYDMRAGVPTETMLEIRRQNELQQEANELERQRAAWSGHTPDHEPTVRIPTQKNRNIWDNS